MDINNHYWMSWNVEERFSDTNLFHQQGKLDFQKVMITLATDDIVYNFLSFIVFSMPEMFEVYKKEYSFYTVCQVVPVLLIVLTGSV